MSVTYLPRSDEILSPLRGHRGLGVGGHVPVTTPSTIEDSPPKPRDLSKDYSKIHPTSDTTGTSRFLAGGMANNVPLSHLHQREVPVFRPHSPTMVQSKLNSTAEVYKDIQPLDFSTKKKSSVADLSVDEIKKVGVTNNNNNYERVSPSVYDKPRSLETSSPEAHTLPNPHIPKGSLPFGHNLDLSVKSSPFHNIGLPPPFPPHGQLSPNPLFAPTCPSPASGINAILLAHIQANPLLLSTLQSAVNSSRIGSQFESYLTSPLTGSFPIPKSPLHSNFSPPNLLGLNPLEASALGSKILGPETLKEAVLADRYLRKDTLAPSLNSASPTYNPLASVSPMSGLTNIGISPNGLRDLIDSSSNVLTSTQAEVVINAESNDSYLKFRKQMLLQVSASKARKMQHEHSTNFNVMNQSDTLFGSSSDISGKISPGVCGGNVSDNGDNCSELEVVDMESCSSFSENSNPSTNHGLKLTTTGDMSSISFCSSSYENNTVGSHPLRLSTEIVKDDAYWERRRKNNEAAKRSRDARRAKEDEIAIRAAFLEQENIKLRIELSSLKSETTKLRCLLYNN